MTTTNLRQPTNPARQWYDLPVPAAAGITIFALYLIVGLVGQIQSTPSTPSAVAVPTPALTTSAPIIVIQKEAAPTAAPATPDQQLYQELEQLRARVAELEQQQAVPAAPVYQPAPEPAYAPQPQYQTDSAPQAPEPPAEQQPAAAPVVAAPVPQAQPTEPPKGSIFFQQTPAQIDLQAEAWRMEHCLVVTDPRTCH